MITMHVSRNLASVDIEAAYSVCSFLIMKAYYAFLSFVPAVLTERSLHPKFWAIWCIFRSGNLAVGMLLVCFDKSHNCRRKGLM